MENKTKKSDTQDFLHCPICGNVIIKLEDSGMTPVCCSRKMEMLEANSSDGSPEHHIPVWEMDGNKVMVKIGSEEHPMSTEHQINWILVKTNKGTHTIFLSPEDKPEACVKLSHCECVTAVYCYCNLHGLWKANIVPDEDCD